MVRALFGCFLILTLSSCELSSFSESSASVKDTSNREYYPSDDPIVVGKVLFQDEAYGRAYSKYKQALDVYPDDPNAWLGFAASADMLRRFDQADFAYKKLQPIIGNRVEFNNNFGYSLLLRGDLIGARRYFLRAYEIDPSNEITANNLELLRNSVNYPKRAAGDLKGI